MSAAPFASAELVDVLANLDTITDAVRLAVCRARDIAREQGRDYPEVADCEAAAGEHDTDIAATCAAWGYVRDANNGEWLNARFSYVQPSEHDHRHGNVPDQQTLLCLTLWSLHHGIEIPFSFEFAKRRPPAA